MQAFGYAMGRGDLPSSLYEAVTHTPEDAEELAYQTNNARRVTEIKSARWQQ
jgi:hypothetical protein